MSRAASRTRANSQGGFSVGPDSGMSSKTACWQFWPFTSQLKDDGHGIQTVIPAKERVKKSPNWLKRLKSGPQRRPRAGGDPYKSLFLLDKWIPAFAGMTLRGLPKGCKFDLSHTRRRESMPAKSTVFVCGYHGFPVARERRRRSPSLAEGCHHGFDGEKQGRAVFWIFYEFRTSHIEALGRAVLGVNEHRPDTDAL